LYASLGQGNNDSRVEEEEEKKEPRHVDIWGHDSINDISKPATDSEDIREGEVQFYSSPQGHHHLLTDKELNKSITNASLSDSSEEGRIMRRPLPPP